MLELLRGGRNLGRVLEVGAFYQTDLMPFDHKVFAIERVAPLATEARAADALELENVVIRHGDGLLGWPELRPLMALFWLPVLSRPRDLFEQLTDGDA